ncbi:MAG: ankyrin repeat protein [Mucilaginibacter sp.]|nr:ankyrin repeat protein [Mucilaginibacter sp.]
MANEIFKLISSNDLKQLRKILADDPNLANEGVTLGDNNPKKGHPLHRLCDAVFAKKITDKQAIEIAKIFLEFGANIDGYKSSKDNNTPLIAAASLNAEQLGIFYIEQGADVFYAAPNDGATALHWAAYCGKDKLVAKLIGKGADLNQRDTKYNGTPMDWAIHTLISKDSYNLYHQLACIKLLLKAGAAKSLLDTNSIQYLQSEAKSDLELVELIK